MKKLNNDDRFALAAKLESILGASDLDADEQYAIEQAIEIVSPEYFAACNRQMKKSQEWYEKQTPESLAAFVKEQEKEYGLSPDWSGTPAVPGKVNGKILRFGEGKKK